MISAENGSYEKKELSAFSSKGKLRFNKDGKFKIVQFIDIHAVPEKGETDHAYDFMNKILDIEKPDFVMYTGDVVVSDDNPEMIWEKVTDISASRNIPFAVVLGNHDSDRIAYSFSPKTGNKISNNKS